MPKNVSDLSKNAGIKWGKMPKHKKLVKYESSKKKGKIRTTKHTNLLALFLVSIYSKMFQFCITVTIFDLQKEIKDGIMP